jgi:hypothetical protein
MKGFAIEPTQCAQKVYVQPDNISLDQGNIWIACDGNWIRVSNLAADEKGFYVSGDQFEMYWKCPVCGWMNTYLNIICQNCHH